MTTLLTIAEVLAGEALVSPAGAIDRDTAVGDDTMMWAFPHHTETPPASVGTAVSLRG